VRRQVQKKLKLTQQVHLGLRQHDVHVCSARVGWGPLVFRYMVFQRHAAWLWTCEVLRAPRSAGPAVYVCMYHELHRRIHIVDIDTSRQLGSLRCIRAVRRVRLYEWVGVTSVH
jgi:hypothetical protein